jgi:hypothetical protein
MSTRTGLKDKSRSPFEKSHAIEGTNEFHLIVPFIENTPAAFVSVYCMNITRSLVFPLPTDDLYEATSMPEPQMALNRACLESVKTTRIRRFPNREYYDLMPYEEKYLLLNISQFSLIPFSGS